MKNIFLYLHTWYTKFFMKNRYIDAMKNNIQHFKRRWITLHIIKKYKSYWKRSYTFPRAYMDILTVDRQFNYLLNTNRYVNLKSKHPTRAHYENEDTITHCDITIYETINSPMQRCVGFPPECNCTYLERPYIMRVSKAHKLNVFVMYEMLITNFAINHGMADRADRSKFCTLFALTSQ